MIRGYVRAQPDWRRVSFPPAVILGFVRAQPDWRRVSFPVVPWLEWGAVAGTTAGELLQVEYTITHPELVRARLVLADGRELAMVVFADHLEVLLPYDTPDGPATVIAELDDGAGRTATAELVILLTGVAVPLPVPRPAGGLPRRSPHRLIRAAPARVGVTAGPVGLERRDRPTTVRLAGAARVRHAPVQRVLARTAVLRRDGPSLEEALLLDLL
jgi:hypothetical protein